ncbi:MAG: alpha/beta hydrolase, partial [Deltaproteobacteria bacterium]|nr:alpha/beta hydrolase [Deltaproteobacteria bacterium]
MTWVSETMEVDGVQLGVRRQGEGNPLVILYGDQLDTQVPPFDDAMAGRFRTVVPSLPGVNRSELPDWVDTMEDVAFLGLDLLEGLDAGPVDVIGHGFGGWVAAEMAVRSQQHIRRLALIDSVGIKVSAPTVRDVQDVYVYTGAEVAELAWHDPAAAKVLRWPGMEGVEGEELLTLLRNRQSVLKFAWRPFMYNPKLLRRLARVR